MANWLYGYGKRVTLTIGHGLIDGALVDFPVTIRLNSSAGLGSTDVTAVFDELGDEDQKLAVTTSDGITQCYVEVELWDAANEWAVLHVKVPAISNVADTILYLYYDVNHADNTAYVDVPGSVVAQSVWDANFKAVYHMGDGADNAHIYDSTDNDNDLTKAGSAEPIETADKAGYAQDFDGLNDFVGRAAFMNLALIGSWTMEFIVNVADLDDYHYILANGLWGGKTGVHFATDGTVNAYYRDNVSAYVRVKTAVLSILTDYLITVVSDSGTLTIYANTVPSTAGGTAIDPGNVTIFTLGKRNKGTETWYKGIMGEVRASDIARAAEWIKATHHALADTLVTLSGPGTPEASGVLVGGVQVTIVSGSLSVDSRIEERSTASFVVIDTNASESYPRGTPVLIYDPDATLVFGGFVDAPTKVRDTKVGLLHTVSCIDNHFLADKRLAVKSYTDKTLAYIVTDLHTSYLSAEGVTLGTIQTGPTFDSVVFNYVRVSDCFDALKELSGFIWEIDESKVLDVIDRATNAAPWQLDNSTYRPVGRPVITGGNPLYRNYQYVRGGTGLTSEQTETFTGDAVTKAFTVGYKIAQVPTVTVDASAQTVGIKGVDTEKNCYWNIGDGTVTFDTAPGNALAVVVVYYGQYPLIALVTSEGQRVSRAAIEGGTGISENMVTETEHNTANSITESAAGKISRYATEAEKFVYHTTTSGIKPGQLQEITYSLFGLAAHEMLIESVGYTSDGSLVDYTVTAITGPAMGSWAKFFYNVIRRQDNAIKLGDSLLLILLRTEETLAVTETTSLDVDDFSSGEVNRWIALPPAQGAACNVQHEIMKLTETTSIVEHATEDYKWG